MTVLAVEAVGAGEAAGAATAGAARAGAARGGARRARRPGRHAASQGGAEQAKRYAQEQALTTGREAGQDALRARVPGDRQYQGVILAEFLVAALIVSVAPLARGKSAQDATGGPSPYGPDDIKQLAGIGAVYFVLALLSSGKHGRIAAWFGGLVLVAIGLSQTTTGGLPAIFGIFQPSSKSAGAEAIPSTSSPQANPNLPGITTPGAPGAGIPGVGQDIGVNTATQSITFSQPGVATTTETSPGVTVT